ncbi:DUF5693 family protein [Bacillus shivajii]|uniref:DUF5693 family protein n=1 Tax=Bacillus shivajii TaxID=1983719 RepID=UPI001CF981B5|nr:DUF5693 family protein [Bacillus shivajii]UCZ51442.1 DUF5693 family protein [Bacillus shivajii]
MQKVLWGIILFTMILNSPFIIERIHVEKSNDNYEIVVPFQDIAKMSEAGIPLETILHDYKGANVTTFSFTPVSLEELHEKQLIQFISKGELINIQANKTNQIPQENGIHIELVDINNPIVQAIPSSINSNFQDIVHTKEFFIGERHFLFVPFDQTVVEIMPISFDIAAIEYVIENGFSVVARLNNNFNFEDDKHPLIQQLYQNSDYINHIVFIDKDVPGYAETSKNTINRMAHYMKQMSLNATLIEGNAQRGLADLVQQIDNKLIRLHSMTLGKDDTSDLSHVNRGLRAINERNIQLLYVNILKKDPMEHFLNPVEAIETLNESLSFFDELNSNLYKESGTVTPLNDITKPKWIEITNYLVASLFIALCFSVLHKRLMVAVFLTTFLMSALALHLSIVEKSIVLFAAVLSPIYAVLSIGNPQTIKQAIIAFFKVIGVTLTGASFVIILLYEWEYLVHLDGFRGVKLLAVLPALIVTLKLNGFTWLKRNMKLWHVFVVTLLIGVTLFYIGRTGNHGITIPYELLFRQELENIFGVRPRTKELIGFPLLILGIYLIKEGYKHGKQLLILGVIACGSVISTFTHLHTPLLISIQRTGLSLLLGAGLGLILIVIWHTAVKRFSPLYKGRFSA